MSNGKENLIDTLIQGAKNKTYQPVMAPSAPSGMEGSTGFEPLNKYDVGLLRGMDQPEQRAITQPDSRALLNSLVQVGTTIVGDAVAGFGYLGELADINDIVSGKETEWGNWLTELGESIKAKGEEVAPVYASREALSSFAPWDGEWWASNIPSIGSTLALAIPAVGTAGLLSKFGQAIGMTAKAGRFATGLGSAIVSRHIENMMEGKETFDRAYQDALAQGRSEDEAKLIAGSAASDTYNTNYVNLLTDIPQYLSLLGVKLPGIGKGSRLRSAGKGFLSEAAEEATQFIIQEEAARGARIELGTEEDDTTFGQRFTKYLSEPGLQTAAFFGGLGGAVFGAIGKEVDDAEKPEEQVRSEALTDITAKAAATGDFEKPIKMVEQMQADPEIAQNEEAVQNLTKAKEVIKHTEKVFKSLKGDPFQQEKTVLAGQAKQLEQVFNDNDAAIAEVGANIKEQDQYQHKILTLQLDALNKFRKTKEGKKYKDAIAEIESEIKSELNSDKFKEEFKPAKVDSIQAHLPTLTTLANQRVKAKIAQKNVVAAINKYSTPEGQQQLQDEFAEAQKKEEAAIRKQAQQAQSIDEINNLIKKFPHMKGDFDKVVSDKAKAEKAEAPADINNYDSAQEFYDARYTGRPFLLADDMNKFKVSSPADLLSKISERYEQKAKPGEETSTVEPEQTAETQGEESREEVSEGFEKPLKSKPEWLEAEIDRQSNALLREGTKILEDIKNLNDQDRTAQQIAAELIKKYPLLSQFKLDDETPKGFKSVENAVRAVRAKYNLPSLDDKREKVQEPPIADTLAQEAAAKAEAEDADVQVINDYSERTAEEQAEDFADNRSIAEESKNPLLGRTNDAALYKVINEEGKDYILFSGVGVFGTRKQPLAKALTDQYRISLKANKWTPLYTTDGNLVESEWRMPEVDIAKLRTIGDITGNQVTYLIDTTSGESNTFESDGGYEGVRIIMQVVTDVMSAPVTIGMLPSLYRNTEFQSSPYYESFVSLRKDIYNEWVAAGKPTRFAYSKPGTVNTVLGGRFLNTSTRNNPSAVTSESLTFAVGVTQGDTTNYDTAVPVDKVVFSDVAKQPTPGAVYMAVKTSNGFYTWSRLFTKKLDNDTAGAKPGMFPIWESLRGGFADVPLSEVVKEILGFSLTNPTAWKENWAGLRREVRSIVRWRNKKGTIKPDFGANLGDILNEKYNGSVEEFYTRNELGSKTLQVNNKLVNTPGYNESIEDRLETDINPFVHTHSPKFEVMPPQSDTVAVDKPEAEEEEFDFGDEKIKFKLADEANYPLWNEAEEVAWFKSRFPNIPIETVAKIKAMGGDAWGAFVQSAGVLISQKAKAGTTFHEAFHVAFTLGLDAKQQANLLAQGRAKYGQNLSDIEVEERLADSFVEFVQTGRTTTLGARIARIFRRLLEFLRFGLSNRMSIERFFDRIESGKYSGVTLGAKFETKYKLVAGFTNLKEQRQRIKEALHFFDMIVDVIKSKAEGLTTIQAVDIARKSKGLFNGAKGVAPGVPSIKMYFERQRNYSKLTTRGKEELERVIAAFDDASFIEELSKHLSGRGVDVAIATDNAEDVRVYEEEESFLEDWQRKAMQISPMENMSSRLKRYLNTIPIRDTRRDAQGNYIPKVSRIGVIQRHDGRFLYADIQSRIGGSISVEDMMSKLDEARTRLPHYNDIWTDAASNADLRTELFRIAQKVHPEFFDIVKEDSGKYAVKSSNTDSMNRVLRSEWLTTYSDPTYNRYLNTEGKVVYADRLNTKWNKVKSDAAAKRDVVDSFGDFLADLGFFIEPDALAMAQHRGEMLQLVTSFEPVLREFLAKAEDKPLTLDNKGASTFAKDVAKYYPTTYQSAHFNVEGNKEYEWINSSYLGRRINTLNSDYRDNVWKMLEADPFYSRLIRDKVIDTEAWNKSRWSVVGGIKHTQGRGVGFQRFSDSDTAITMLTMFKEGWYNTSVNSSSTPVLSAIKLGQLEKPVILSRMKALAYAENARAIQKSNVKGWKNYTPDNYAFFPYLAPGEAVPENIEELIKNDFEKQYQQLYRNLLDMGLIDKNTGKLTFDESLTTDVFLQEFIYNFNLREAEIILMMQGDPNFYKKDKEKRPTRNINKTDDFFKRAREVWSPGNYLDTTATFRYGDRTIRFPADGKYRVKILRDVVIPSPQLTEIRDALMKSAGQSDADRISRLYEDVNVTDAQSWIDLYSYRLRMIGESRWTPQMQNAYDILITGREITAQDVTDAVTKGIIFQPIKPFYYALHLYETLVYPMQNKDSEFLIVPSLANTNPYFAEVLGEMGYIKSGDNSWSLDEAGRDAGKYVDKVSFESAIKVEMGAPFIGQTLAEATPVEMNWADWRRQLETPEHHLDADARFGTQIMKLIIADLADDAVFGDKTGKEIKAEYEHLVSEDIKRSSGELANRFTNPDGTINKEAFVQVVREEVNRRQLGDQYIDALEWTYNEVLDRWDTALPLFHPLHSTKVEAMISSLFKNNITKQMFQTGVALYNVTAHGFERKPRIKFNTETGAIEYIECYAPVYSSYLEKYRLPNGEMDMDAIVSNEPELLDGLVYRIPTEDKYSMFNIKIIGFLPQAVGGGIVLPPEVTTIAGLDFDIDKTFGYFRSKGNLYQRILNKLNAKIERNKDTATRESDVYWDALFNETLSESDIAEVELAETLKSFGSTLAAYNEIKRKAEQHAAKQASDNAKLDLMKSVLSHPSMTKAFLDPGGFKTIKGVVAEIKRLKGETKEYYSVASPLTVMEGIRRINLGSALTGIAANYNAAKARWQQWPMKMKKSFIFDGENYNDLSITDEFGARAKEGRKVSRNIAEVLASAVDNGKDPLAESYNLNTYTADVAMSMLAVGIPLPTVMTFLSQPAIVKYVTDYFNAGGKEPALGIGEIDSAININSNELLDNLKSPQEEDQNKFLQNFIYYKKMVAPVGDLVTATKIPDQGAGPSIADSVVRQRRYTRTLEDYIEGADGFLKDESSFHHAFYTEGIKQALTVFNELGFPNFTGAKSGIKAAFDSLYPVKGSELTEAELNTVYKHFMEYLVSDNPAFSFEQASELHNNLHTRLAKAQANPEIRNIFLDRLETYKKIINFRAVISIHKEEFDDYRQSWAEMLGDDRPISSDTTYTVHDLAIDLLKYSFFRAGFTASGFGNFAHLQPIEFYTKTEEGKNLTNHIIKAVEAQNSAADLKPYTLFVDQFIRNNYLTLSYVPRMDKADIAFNESGIPIGLNKTSSQVGSTWAKYYKRNKKGDITGAWLFKSDQGIFRPVPTLGLVVDGKLVMREYRFGHNQLESTFMEENIGVGKTSITPSTLRNRTLVTYKGKITKLGNKQVFVFGSNLRGFHGGGSAGFASFGVSGNKWREFEYDKKPTGWKGKWNVKGQGEGLQQGTEGMSYALPTVTSPGAKRSLTPDQIAVNVRKFYEEARKNPDLEFLVAYSADASNLNGYTPKEMADIFVSDKALKGWGDVPLNVFFEEGFAALMYPTNIESAPSNIKTEMLGTATEKTTGKPSEYTNWSGGARGADTEWKRIGEKYGISRTRDFRPEDLDKLTPEQLDEVEWAYQEAFRYLGRRELAEDTPAGKLVRRDYLQAKKADAVFAISEIVQPGQKGSKGFTNNMPYPIVEGGTGYAVTMAIQMDKPVYVFDQNEKQWYKWEGNTFIRVDTPILTRNFAGIGTQRINADGIAAIEAVYAKTFNRPDTSQFETITPEDFTKQAEVQALDVPDTSTGTPTMPNYYRLNGVDIELQTYRDGKVYPIELTEDQKKGLQALADYVDANYDKADVTPFVLKGKAGTGKTTLIRLINQYIKKTQSGVTSLIITTSHRAGRVASMATYGNQNQYRTNASAFSNPMRYPSEKVLIFDEISMNDDFTFQDASAHFKKARVLPIFVGDIRQIPPVAGNKISQFFNTPNQYELTEIVRFQNQGPIFTIADTFAENLKIFDPLTAFPKHVTDGNETVQSYDNRDKFINSFLTVAQSEPDLSSTRIVTYSNNSIRSYTTTIRSKLFAKRRSTPGFEITPFEGEPITGSAAWSTHSPLQSPVLNSVDYIVTEDSYTDTWDYAPGLRNTMRVTGSVVTMKEVSEQPTLPTTIMIVDLGANPDFAKVVAYNMFMYNSLPRKQRFYSEYNKNLDAIEKTGFYALEPIYAKVDKASGTVTLLNSPEGANVTVDPNISFGYALTAHKAQGGTYKNVFVDEHNMSAFAKDRKVYDRQNNFFSWEQNQLKYVGFSRAAKNLHIFTNKPITEDSNLEVRKAEPLPEPIREVPEIQRPSLKFEPDNIEKIMSGKKTTTNRTFKIPSGTYDIGEGNLAEIEYLGEAKVNKGNVNPGVLLGNTTIPFDKFAQDEGFQSWADFEQNNKFSANFISGRETRHLYKVTPITLTESVQTIEDFDTRVASLWLNYQSNILAKKPGYTYEKFLNAAKSIGLERMEEQLKCYD